MAVDLSVHTMVIRNRVSSSEASYLCRMFGKSLSKNVEISGSDIKIAGINQINIKGMRIPSSGIWTYDIEIMVNVGRLIGKTNYAMLVLDKHNAKAVVRTLDNILMNKFALKNKHCRSADWHIKRLDCGIDLRLCTDEEAVYRATIKALHDSFDSNNSRGIQYEKYKGYDAPNIRYESITLETSGYQNGKPNYRYNIYHKFRQLQKYALEYGIQLSQDDIDEVKNVIRIEKQIDDVSKILGGGNRLGLLLDEYVTEKVMNTIVKEVRLLFGTGDYLAYDEAVAIIYASEYELQEQNRMAAIYAYVYDNGYPALLDYFKQNVLSHGGTEAVVGDYYKEVAQIRKRIEALGISIASVHSDTSVKGISTVLDEELKAREKPRKKRRFCNIIRVHEKSGNVRYKCNPTLHHADGTTYRPSVSGAVGGSYEDCERKVFEKIRSNLNQNYPSLSGKPEEQIRCCEYAFEEYSNFRTVVKSKAVIKDIDLMLEKITNAIAKKRRCIAWNLQQ